MAKRMVFRNYGGDYQLRIETAEDLENVLALDDARWAATSAPIAGLQCDAQFLALLDSDANGRIRSDEIRAGIEWLLRMLSNRERLAEQTEVLRLADIDSSHDEGRGVRGAAKLILENLDKPDAAEISLAQVRDLKHILSSAANNGDGVIPPDAADDEGTKALIEAVMDCAGSVADASGQNGITKELLDAFLSEARAFLDWEARGRTEKGGLDERLFPWGHATTGAWERILALDEKIEDFFTLCDMIRYEPRAAEAMGLKTAELEAMDFADRSGVEERLADAPLAEPNAEGLLRFETPINPVYEQQLFLLCEKVLARAMGKPPVLLTRKQWRGAKELFAPHAAWLGEQRGEKAAKLGPEKLADWLDGPAPGKVSHLIAADKAVAGELQMIGIVEKLILYQQWMLEFANSFVCFSRLYDPAKRSLFEMGTLVIDGRHLTFSVRVDDRARHKKLAETGNMCILYVEVAGGRKGAEKFEVVTAVTAGDSVGLSVEKQGVFVTPDGRKWDARVVDMIDSPVSLWESFKAPFRKAGGFVTQRIEKFSKTQEAKVDSAMAAPKPGTATRDMILAGSIGFAALGSSLAYITKAIHDVDLINVASVLAGLALIILGPNLLLGYSRLRRRDLTTLLEASGWAINLHMLLTGGLGGLFTRRIRRPKGSKRDSRDLVGEFSKQMGVSELNWTRIMFLALSGGIVLLIAALYAVVILYV